MNAKVWSVHHIIIVKFIIRCSIGGLQKSGKFIRTGHTFGGCWLLLILMMFQYKSMVSCSYNHCDVHHQICYRGSSEMSQIHVQWSHFLRLVVIVDFDNVSIQKYGQFIIYSLSCSPIEFAIASLPCYDVSFEGLDCQLGSSL